jgi:hypothetical protein
MNKVNHARPPLAVIKHFVEFKRPQRASKLGVYRPLLHILYPNMTHTAEIKWLHHPPTYTKNSMHTHAFSML